MGERKSFIVVHQKNVEEFDSLDDALQGIDETRKDYHQGPYRVYTFEGGMYQLVVDDFPHQIGLANQNDYETRRNRDLEPFAVVDKADNSKLIGTRVHISGIGTIELTEDNLPQLKYHGFDNPQEAKAEFEKRRNNQAGLYSLVAFHQVLGPERRV
ncbi:MAG: hypothetical protein Q8N99_00980 [Nanoarchaeota archaeon]|nr:hypothetical protein [Nanoarchaeota archaeon]